MFLKTKQKNPNCILWYIEFTQAYLLLYSFQLKHCSLLMNSFSLVKEIGAGDRF